MTALLGLLLLGVLLSTAGPVVLARARWAEREPVLALLVWQCLVVAVLLCCVLSLLLAVSAALPEVRALFFTGAPHGVEAAYGLAGAEGWGRFCAALLALGGLRTALSLTREIRSARALRGHRHAELAHRAPELPAGIGRLRTERERLVVLENLRPEAWSLPGPGARLVVTTGALQRLTARELAAVLSHERGHVRARHHWLSQCAQALAAGFPRVGVFSAFRDQVGELVELAADDRAARRHGRLTTALAMVELNTERGVFGLSCPGQLAQAPRRVDRLLAGEPRLTVSRRLQLTVVALAAPAAVVLLAAAPGISALVQRLHHTH
ncbi:Zn-dependent protease with chaperone function [Kitasatospora sp. MAP12-15]|uniref:M56 family metallopeptidase n=1 Tax=unclassified Kitasatospora TaxID=2633591 RepID=UPI002476CD99|nr:M56 family metallopeptidase [Kitasatospora sp. MAP12-44]MDH6109115.1 Zn-dependent protease with chaperone function [Kitasatospora sp. MAP12-44]